jgi:hypothetical protein
MLVQLLFAPTEETATILFSQKKSPDLDTLAFWLKIMLGVGAITIFGA